MVTGAADPDEGRWEAIARALLDCDVPALAVLDPGDGELEAIMPVLADAAARDPVLARFAIAEMFATTVGKLRRSIDD